MDKFQSIESGKGILKEAYESGETPLYEALKRRNKKRKEKLLDEQEV